MIVEKRQFKIVQIEKRDYLYRVYNGYSAVKIKTNEREILTKEIRYEPDDREFTSFSHEKGIINVLSTIKTPLPENDNEIFSACQRR